MKINRVQGSPTYFPESKVVEKVRGKLERKLAYENNLINADSLKEIADKMKTQRERQVSSYHVPLSDKKVTMGPASKAINKLIEVLKG